MHHDAFVDDLKPVVSNTINEIVKIADKNNIDRDNAMQYFSKLFEAMTVVSTFEHWEVQDDQYD